MGCGISRGASQGELTSKDRHVSFREDRLEVNVESEQYQRKYQKQLKKKKKRHAAQALDGSGSLLLKSGKFSSRHVKQTEVKPKTAAAAVVATAATPAATAQARARAIDIPLLSDDDHAQKISQRTSADAPPTAHNSIVERIPTEQILAALPKATPAAPKATPAASKPSSGESNTVVSKVAAPINPPPQKTTPAPPSSTTTANNTTSKTAASATPTKKAVSDAVPSRTIPAAPRPVSPMVQAEFSKSPHRRRRASPNVDLHLALQVADAKGKPLSVMAPHSPTVSRPPSPNGSEFTLDRRYGLSSTLGTRPRSSTNHMNTTHNTSTRPPLATAGPSARRGSTLQGASSRTTTAQPYDFSMFMDSRDTWIGAPSMASNGDAFNERYCMGTVSETASVRGDNALNGLIPSPRPRSSGGHHEATHAHVTRQHSSPSAPRGLPSAFNLESFLFTSTDLHGLRASNETTQTVSSLVKMSGTARGGGGGGGRRADTSTTTTADQVRTDRSAVDLDETWMEHMAPVERKTRSFTKPTKQPEASAETVKDTPARDKKDPSAADNDDDDEGSGGGRGLVHSSSDLSDVLVGSSMSLLAEVKGRRRTVTIVDPGARPPPLRRPPPPMQLRANTNPPIPGTQLQSPMNAIQGPQNPTSPHVNAFHAPQQTLVGANGVHYHQPPMLNGAPYGGAVAPMTPVTSVRRPGVAWERMDLTGSQRPKGSDESGDSRSARTS